MTQEYRKKRILRDADNVPIPQYWDEDAGDFKPMPKVAIDGDIEIGDIDVGDVGIIDGGNKLKVNEDGSIDVKGDLQLTGSNVGEPVYTANEERNILLKAGAIESSDRYIQSEYLAVPLKDYAFIYVIFVTEWDWNRLDLSWRWNDGVLSNPELAGTVPEVVDNYRMYKGEAGVNITDRIEVIGAELRWLRWRNPDEEQARIEYYIFGVK